MVSATKREKIKAHLCQCAVKIYNDMDSVTEQWSSIWRKQKKFQSKFLRA